MDYCIILLLPKTNKARSTKPLWNVLQIFDINKWYKIKKNKISVIDGSETYYRLQPELNRLFS